MTSHASVRIVAIVAIGLLLGGLGCGGGGGGGKARVEAPTGLAARSDASGQVILDWTPVVDVSTYHVYWSTSPGVDRTTGTRIAAVPRPFTHTGLTDGTTYFYVVTGAVGAAESKPSGEASALPIAAPSITSIGSTTSQVTLEWGSVAGATGYDIYWSTAPGVTKATGTRIPGATSPHVHVGLADGTMHHYIVIASNAVGGGAESSASAEASATPVAAPLGVVAAPGDGQVTITWSAVTGATSYTIYRATTPGVTRSTGTPLVGVSSPHTDTGLANGTTYYFVVTALGATGESVESAEVWATPLPAPPPPPPNPVTLVPGDTEIVVSWGPVAGAISYNIYFGTATGVTKATGTPIPSVTSPFLHAGLTNGTTYYYVMTSVGSTGEGVESGEVSATPALPPPPAPPDPVSLAAGNGEVTISWGPVVDANSYNIYWSISQGVTKGTGTPILSVTSPYAHTGLVNGTTYYYVMTSVGAGGEGVESPEGSATPVASSIGPPAGLRAIAADAEVTLTWFPVGGATDYHLYWSTSPGLTKTTGTKIASVLPPYVHSGLANLTTYYYIVTAEDGAGEGPDSPEVQATPNSSGAPDPTFGGGDGVVSHNNAAGGGSVDFGLGVALDASGRILVAGTSVNNNFDYDMALWRLTDTGVLDTTFNGQGWVTHGAAAGGVDGDDAGWDVIVDGTGRILVTGFSASSTGDDDMVIWAYDDAGALDPTYGTGGIVTHDNAGGGNGWDEGRAMTFDAGGFLVIAGFSDGGPGLAHDMAVWRYDATGNLDPSFAGNGFTTHSNAAGGTVHDEGEAVWVDAAGRIVIAGRSYGGPTHYDLAIWRYEANGLIDATFGTGGFVIFHDAAGGNNYDGAFGLAIDGGGSIVAAGQSYDGSSSDMVLWKYDSGGALDVGFGNGGTVVVSDAAGGNGYDTANAVVLDSSGRLVVAGHSSSVADDDLVLWRYEPTGVPDATFGANGLVIHDNAAGGMWHDGAEDLVIDASGRIVVTGWSDGGPGWDDMAVWRFNP